MCMNRFRLEAVEMPEKSVSGFQNAHTIKEKKVSVFSRVFLSSDTFQKGR